MKKLLVATSALVAAGSAAALDVTLGGKIEFQADYYSGSDTKSLEELVTDIDLTVGASGESMGWTYGAEGKLSVFTVDGKVGKDADKNRTVKDNKLAIQLASARIYAGSGWLGTVEINTKCGNFVDFDGDYTVWSDEDEDGRVGSVYGDACFEWNGLDLGIATVGLALTLDKTGSTSKDTKQIVYGDFDLGLVSLEAEYDFDQKAIDGIAGANLGSAGLELAFVSDNDFDNFDYSVAADTDLAGYGVRLQYAPDGSLNGKDKDEASPADVDLEVTRGCFAAGLGWASGDSNKVDGWSLRYDCDVLEGLSVDVKVGDLDLDTTKDSDLEARFETIVSF